MNKKFLADNIVGTIPNPWGPEGLNVPEYTGGEGQGLIILLNNLLKLAIVAGGIFAFINIIIAGYEFMSAQGDTEKITNAWNKIWQSLVGLLIMGGSLVIAALFGYLIFNDPSAIISPKIFGPGDS